MSAAQLAADRTAPDEWLALYVPAGNANHNSASTGAAAAGEDLRQSVRVGKLNLVDLAGSERVHITGAIGGRLCWLQFLHQHSKHLGLHGKRRPVRRA